MIILLILTQLIFASQEFRSQSSLSWGWGGANITWLKYYSYYSSWNVLYLQTIDTLAKLGLSVTPSVAFNQKKKMLQRQTVKIGNLMLKEKEEIEKSGTCMTENQMSSDIIGDNIDLSRSPSQMSVEKRRKSWHWFLMVGLQKRVLNPSLDDTAPISDINKVENGTFIPNLDDCSKLDQNFLFHIMNVLVKYVDCLNKYKDCLP